MPFPSEDVTPPVTNMYFVSAMPQFFVTGFKGTNSRLESQENIGKIYPTKGQHEVRPYSWSQ